MYHIKETGFVSTVLSELLWIIIKLHIQCSACIYIYTFCASDIYVSQRLLSEIGQLVSTERAT